MEWQKPKNRRKSIMTARIWRKIDAPYIDWKMLKKTSFLILLKQFILHRRHSNFFGHVRQYFNQNKTVIMPNILSEIPQLCQKGLSHGNFEPSGSRRLERAIPSWCFLLLCILRNENHSLSVWKFFSSFLSILTASTGKIF